MQMRQPARCRSKPGDTVSIPLRHIGHPDRGAWGEPRGQTSLPASYHSGLDAVIAANWH
ncbi:hypothetical protein [Variovorax sp. PBL-E5]|uniref:hypothetical protein n=1 Tax=Variovorax sp. PBL-E5 TaxID=434014 RepID=UPI0013A54D1B|nr:hypothetical protein [Variovorax sp. PBL-E5]